MASTLFEVLELGDRASPALVVGSGGRIFTRGEVHALATKFAMTLIEGGIKAGDVVTIAEPNTVEFVIAFLGCTYARGIAAPLNQNYTKSEFSYYMEDANSKLLVVGPNGNEAAESAALESNIPAISLALSNHDNDDNRAVVVNVQVKEGKFRVTDVNDKGEELAALPHPNDVALFLHTSGTTSRPKGVPLTHGNLTASLANISKTYEFSNQDVSLLVMPLFHVHGGLIRLLFTSGESMLSLPCSGQPYMYQSDLPISLSL